MSRMSTLMSMPKLSLMFVTASFNWDSIFLRRYWYLDTVAEIAHRYGMTESKVKTSLHRTRGKLHTFLEKEGISV